MIAAPATSAVLMTAHLTDAQIERYNEQGFLSPVPALSPDEASRYRELLENFEQQVPGTAPPADLHLLCGWAWDLVHDPRIVRPVTDLLGPDVLLWSLNWFIKEPHAGKMVSLHQDATYWGLEPHDVLTAWVALSDAGPQTGPMHFLPGSHRGPLYEHTNTFAENNLLTRGQTIPHLDAANAVPAPLAAGEMSLHHVRLVHGSEPNQSDDRRIGLVLRYCGTHVRQTKVDRDTATLVAGEDHHGHFELTRRPQVDHGELERERHKDAMQQMTAAILS